MSVKSRGDVYNRLEKVVYLFCNVQKQDVSLTGHETTEEILSRFNVWVTNGGLAAMRKQETERMGRVDW